MYPILAWNAQNHFCFWGSAEGAYTMLPKPPSRKELCAFGNRSFVLAISPTSTFWYAPQLSLLDNNFFPSCSPYSIPGSAPVREVCGADELWIFLYSLSNPIYVYRPSVISWILHLVNKKRCSPRGHPFMTSTKKSGFWPLSPRPHGPDPPCGRPHSVDMKYTLLSWSG